MTETPLVYTDGQICDKVFTSAGATGSVTGTFTQTFSNGTFGNYVAWLVALKDAGGGSTFPLPQWFGMFD